MPTKFPTMARRALIWIRDEQHHQGRWLTGRRDVRGDETGTHFELRGHRRVIRISTKTMNVIRPMIKASKRHDRMYELNRNGRVALVESAP